MSAHLPALLDPPEFGPAASLVWNQFWQVTLVVLVVAVVVRLFCRRRPHLAYLLWLLVILKCITPPIVASPTGLFSWATARVIPTSSPSSLASPSSASSPSSVGDHGPPVPLPAQEGVVIIPENPLPTAGSLVPTIRPVDTAPTTGPVRVTTVLGTIWLCGAVAYAATVTGMRIRWSLRLRHRTRLPGGALASLFAELSERMEIKRRVRLLVTSEPVGPVVYGWFRPTLLLPELLCTEKSQHTVKTILAHELTHVRRQDTAVGVLQLAAQTLWWFHPLVWWANREVSRERERCCDEEVVAGLNCEPAQYAQSLFDILVLKHKLQSVFAFPGVRPVQINSRRMEEIMEPARRFHRRTPRWCWLVILAAAVLIIPGRGLVIGRAAEAAKPDDPIGVGTEAAKPHQKEPELAAVEEKAEVVGKSAAGEAEPRRNVIADPETGLEFRRFATFANEPPTVAWHSALSPNGKFLLSHSNVVPVDGGAPFTLGNTPAIWGKWSPDGRKIAFGREREEGSWVVSVSPETAKPTGPPERLLENRCLSCAWSPDAEAVAYVPKEGGSLWVHSLGDDSEAKISDVSVLSAPSWSPDGKWFAFSDVGILLISSDGRRSRKLVKGLPFGNPGWTPDSQWVFCQSTGKLQFVRVADSLCIEVNIPQEVGGYLSCTPDGKNMLFYQPGHAWCSSLKLVNVLSGEVREPLKELFYSGVFQHWSPDSKYLATSDWHRFWIVPVSGEEPYPLKLDVQTEGTLHSESISPDGQRLVFRAMADGKREHYVVPISLAQGKTTGEAVKVFGKNIDRRPGQFGKWSPQIMWSPDGTRLALVSDRNVWVVGTDGSDPRQLSEDPDLTIRLIRWSADGKKITWESWPLFSSPASSTWHICELPNGEPRELTGPLGSSRYQASEDGRTAVYVLGDGKKRALWVETLPRGERKKLLELGEGLAYFSLWPDGTAVAVATTPVDPELDGRFSIYSLPDGQQRRISDLPDPSARSFSLPALCSPALSPDRRVFTLRVERRNASNPWRCFSLSIPEGKWTELQLPNETQGLSADWSPDRKWIAYATHSVRQIRPEGVIWAADICKFLRDAAKKATAGSGPPEG